MSTAAAAPGALSISAPKSTISIQDADHLQGAHIGASTVDGFHSGSATDGTITPSAFFKPIR